MSIRLFSPGDSVKLTDRIAASLANNSRARVNWRSRRGVVHSCSDVQVFIKWDGRSSTDNWPIKAVEHCAPIHELSHRP